MPSLESHIWGWLHWNGASVHMIFLQQSQSFTFINLVILLLSHKYLYAPISFPWKHSTNFEQLYWCGNHSTTFGLHSWDVDKAKRLIKIAINATLNILFVVALNFRKILNCRRFSFAFLYSTFLHFWMISYRNIGQKRLSCVSCIELKLEMATRSWFLLFPGR